MSKLKTNLKFVRELLSSEGISDFERLHILQLFESEMKNFEKGVLELSEKLIKTKLDKHIKNENGEIQSKIKHNPTAVQKLLIHFTLKNKPVKFLTHPIDSNIANIESIFNSVHDYSYYREWSNLKFLDKQLWFKVIFPFIFQKKLNKNQIEGDYHWGIKHKIKMGWQYPSIIKDWCKQNFDDVDTYNRKFPSEMKIPKEFLPRDNEGRLIRVNGKSIKYFQDYVDLFNTEIRFNDGDLNSLIVRLVKENLPQHTVDLNDLKKILPKIYINTSKVEDALRLIFIAIHDRTEFKNVKISSKINKQTERLILKIEHINSLTSSGVNFKKSHNNGTLSNIIDVLENVCDFSVLVKYEDTNLSERFDYLWDGMLEGDVPKNNGYSEKIEGFTFVLEFLLPKNE